jgi:hypothetical protein
MIFKLMLLCLWCLSFIGSVCAQATAISRDKYFAEMEAADVKSDSIFPRRIISVETKSSNGATIPVRKQTWEYVDKDSIRRTIETSNGGRTDKREYIQLGQLYFCKEGPTWKKSKSDCQPHEVSMMPDGDTEEFTAEDVTLNGESAKSYRWYKEWRYPKTAGGLNYFYEQVFFVNSKGELIESQIRQGQSKRPQSDETFTKITNEYPTFIPHITAPVK